MASLKIEKVNIPHIKGHNGYGRLNLIGKDSALGVTDKQAAKLIGDGIIDLYNKHLRDNNVDKDNEGVRLVITFETYKKDGNN